MSKESYCFEAESGKTAFLAGVVDVLSDNLSLHCGDFNAFDADVFYAPDQDISKQTDAVKKRMRSYFSLLGSLNQPEKIEALAFDHLVRVDSDPEQFMIDTVDELEKGDDSKDAISEFLHGLVCIWESRFALFIRIICPTRKLLRLARRICMSLGNTFLLHTKNTWF